MWKRALAVCAVMSAMAFNAGQASVTALSKPRGEMVQYERVGNAKP